MNDNLVQTFQLENSNLRGRILRLGSVMHDMLDRHAYPEPVARVTGEAAILSLLMSSMLKYDGIFTLQTQGDGPVSMVVADITQQGVVRACAKFDTAALAGVDASTALLGAGHLAFTVDQGPDTERYQGIVALEKTLQDSVQHYFLQSEQIATGIRIAVDRMADGRWRAGAIMLQRLPEQGSAQEGEAHEDDWRNAMVLLQSCRDEELLDENLLHQDLLFRLFHEAGVRVYDPLPVAEGCRCSQERAEHILDMMSADDRADMVVDGKITVTCEFCNRAYVFDNAGITPQA